MINGASADGDSLNECFSQATEGGWAGWSTVPVPGEDQQQGHPAGTADPA